MNKKEKLEEICKSYSLEVLGSKIKYLKYGKNYLEYHSSPKYLKSKWNKRMK